MEQKAGGACTCTYMVHVHTYLSGVGGTQWAVVARRACPSKRGRENARGSSEAPLALPAVKAALLQRTCARHIAKHASGTGA